MDEAVRQPLDDKTSYGYGRDDSISISDATENAAITHKEITLKGQTIPYTARAGHLVTADQYTAQPVAKIFYVAFTAMATWAPTRGVPLPFSIMAAQDRPRSFFY
jgi:carboxypeptidase C (cathepsin A)